LKTHITPPRNFLRRTAKMTAIYCAKA